MLRPLQNNKGTIVDIVIIIAVMLAFVIATVVGFHVFNKYKESRENSGENLSKTEQTILKGADTTKGVMDYSIIFVIFGLGLFAIISAYFIDTHPAFFFISIVLLVITIVLSAVTSNAYHQFVNNTLINETTAEFQKSNWVMDKLPVFSLIIGFIVLLVMYAKYQMVPR